MVKNLIGGNKAKSLSNKKQNFNKIKLFKKPNDFEYIGKITKELGSARFDINFLYDKKIININCSVSKSIRVKLDDFVLITILRGNEINNSIKGEIVHKYEQNNLNELKDYDEIYAKEEKRENIIKLLNKSESYDNTYELNYNDDLFINKESNINKDSNITIDNIDIDNI